MTDTTADMTTTALANWYGSNRMLAEHVGVELRGCKWVGIPFAGGMCEIPHIDARQLLVNDLHRHVINLARVVADPVLGPLLYRNLRRLAFHPVELEQAQLRCTLREIHSPDIKVMAQSLFDTADTGGFEPGRLITLPAGFEEKAITRGRPDYGWAVDYFITTWMGRGGKGGKADEFRGGLPIRWNANGGGSAVRYFSAVRSLLAWKRTLQRCEFTTDDAFDFLASVADVAGNGVYADPPFPGPGDLYLHQMGPRGQERLAEAVARFRQTRVVMRFYDVPLIRELYPEGTGPGRWVYVCRDGRTQANGKAAEVLLINGPSRAKEAA